MRHRDLDPGPVAPPVHALTAADVETACARARADAVERCVDALRTRADVLARSSQPLAASQAADCARYLEQTFGTGAPRAGRRR